MIRNSRKNVGLAGPADTGDAGDRHRDAGGLDHVEDGFLRANFELDARASEYESKGCRGLFVGHGERA